MPHRVEQVESALRRAVSRVLAGRLADPRVAAMVSVTRVSVSPDLAQAQVFVSILPPQAAPRTLAGLKHAAGHVQTKVRSLVAMRHVPRLEFRLDESIKKQARIHQAIARGLARDQAGPSAPHEESDRPRSPADQETPPP